MSINFAPQGGFFLEEEAPACSSSSSSFPVDFDLILHPEGGFTFYAHAEAPTKKAPATKTLDCCSYAPSSKAAPAPVKRTAKCSICMRKIQTSYEGRSPSCKRCLKDKAAKAKARATSSIATEDDDSTSVVSTASFATNSSLATATTATTATTSTTFSSGGGRSAGQRRRRATHDLVVRNVNSDEFTLETVFGRYGEVVDVRKPAPKASSKRTNASKSKDSRPPRYTDLPIAFVSFAKREDAERARLAIDGFRAHSTVWEVEWAKAKK